MGLRLMAFGETTNWFSILLEAGGSTKEATPPGKAGAASFYRPGTFLFSLPFMLRNKPIEESLCELQLFHGLDCRDGAIFPFGVDRLPIGRELSLRSSEMLPLLLGNLDALELPLAGGLPFKLSESSEHGEHKLALRGSGVHLFLEADEGNTLLIHLLEDVQEVLCAAGKPADAFNEDDIPFPDEVEHPLQLRPVHALPADLLSEDLVQLAVCKGLFLTVRVLLERGHPDISDSIHKAPLLFLKVMFYLGTFL